MQKNHPTVARPGYRAHGMQAQFCAADFGIQRSGCLLILLSHKLEVGIDDDAHHLARFALLSHPVDDLGR